MIIRFIKRMVLGTIRMVAGMAVALLFAFLGWQIYLFIGSPNLSYLFAAGIIVYLLFIIWMAGDKNAY